jgi:hypothetical protein
VSAPGNRDTQVAPRGVPSALSFCVLDDAMIEDDAHVEIERAEVLREYGPYPNAPKVNGVTFDVDWFG